MVLIRIIFMNIGYTGPLTPSVGISGPLVGKYLISVIKGACSEIFGIFLKTYRCGHFSKPIYHPM